MLQRPLILLMILTISLVAFVLQGEITDQKELSSQNERYYSSNAGYSVLFPKNWEIMKGFMGTDVVALAPIVDPEDLFRENANIIYTEFEAPISKEDYYSHNIKSLHELLSDFDLEIVEDVKLNGVDVKKIRFTHQIGVVNTTVVQYLILDGGKAYVMSFTADPLDFPKLKHQFETIAKSFKLE